MFEVIPAGGRDTFEQAEMVMKKSLQLCRTLIASAVVLALGLLPGVPRAQQSSADNFIKALRTQTPLRIDGCLDEEAWQRAVPVWLSHNRSGQAVQDSRLTTRVMTCHDDSTLYIAYVCHDPDIWSRFTRRDEYLWTEEAVEVFIDVDAVPETYVEIEVSPANVLFDSYIVDPQNIDIPATAAFDLPGIRTAVTVTGTLNMHADSDTSWQVEIAISWRDLAANPPVGMADAPMLRINFYRLDKNQGMESASYAWSPTGGRFHKPAAFGRLLLSE